LYIVYDPALPKKLKLRLSEISRGSTAERNIGRSAGPKGGPVFAIGTPKGTELTPYDPEFAPQMEDAERVMREDRAAQTESFTRNI
jgi:hypothetical protein